MRTRTLATAVAFATARVLLGLLATACTGELADHASGSREDPLCLECDPDGDECIERGFSGCNATHPCCVPGDLCRNGICELNCGGGRSTLGQPCRLLVDCCPGSMCDNGFCGRYHRAGEPCENQFQCDPNQNLNCVNGFCQGCQSSGGPCSSSSDCCSPYQCNSNGQCGNCGDEGESCSRDSDCCNSVGFHCVSGTCVEGGAPDGGMSVPDASVPPGGACERACNSDTDCGSLDFPERQCCLDASRCPGVQAHCCWWAVICGNGVCDGTENATVCPEDCRTDNGPMGTYYNPVYYPMIMCWYTYELHSYTVCASSGTVSSCTTEYEAELVDVSCYAY